MRNTRKKIFVVLGMPRSGTSAIAHALNILGVDFGDSLTPADTLWNPTGFWEDKDISNQINCGVLFAIDFAWESLRLVDAAQCTTLSDLKNKAINLLNQRMAFSDCWGFKDPRTAKIIPFWQSVFETAALEDHYLITLRNPLSSAHSFHRLRHFDLESGLILWLMHLYPAIQDTFGKKRLIVSFENMIENPCSELDRIQSYFNLPSICPTKKMYYTHDFLKPSLSHYQHSLADLDHHPAAQVVPL